MNINKIISFLFPFPLHFFEFYAFLADFFIQKDGFINNEPTNNKELQNEV